jgi:hypothetical protein
VITSTPATREEHQPSGLLDGAIASFLKQLQAAGYAKKSLRDKRAVVRTFADWLRRSHITLDAINESHVAAFLKRTPGTLPPRLKYKHAALSGFLKYLRRVRLQPSCRDAVRISNRTSMPLTTNSRSRPYRCQSCPRMVGTIPSRSMVIGSLPASANASGQARD